MICSKFRSRPAPLPQGIAKPAGRSGRRFRAGRDRGFALVVVIMVILIVSFLASQLTMQVRAELKIAANEKARAISHFLAEAGVSLSLFWLLGDKPLENETGVEVDFLEGYGYEDRLPAGLISYYAVNEAGKIDLNVFPRPLLELFLTYHGLAEEEVAIVIDSLLDWRDGDDLHRLQGAEAEVYQQLADPYIPRNGNLEEPAEFFLVNGTQPLVGRFPAAEVFTVHNTTNKININSLTPAMLDFLTEGDPAHKEAYREAQELHGNIDSGVARTILGDERYSQLSPYLGYEKHQTLLNQNPYWYIEAVGRADYGQEEAADKENNQVEDGKENESEDEEDNNNQPSRPGIKTKVLVKISGSTVEYLSWMEEYI